MPGAGLSPADPLDDYTDPRVVSLLLALMDRLEIPDAVLIGNSIGGRIAWRMAAEHPARVSGLVLVAPDGFASPTFSYGEAPEVPAIMHASKVFMPRWAVRPNLAVAYADPDALDEPTLERYHDLLLAPGNRGALISRMEQTVLTDPVPFLERIDVPVLLLWGEEDGMIPVQNGQDYLDALPNARLVRLPDLGHLPMEEGPARSLEPVLEFLESRNDS
jgi:pimeloyl-ACP methyl ester carboxylesterase